MTRNPITKRYYELLEKKKEFKNAGRDYREYSRLPEMKELIEYEITLSNGKKYQNCNLYLDCIEKFLANIIDGDEMTGKFMMLRKADMDRELPSIIDENFNQKPEISSFAQLIDELFFVCEAFDEEATTYEECNETWLHDTVLELYNEWKERNSQVSY